MQQLVFIQKNFLSNSPECKLMFAEFIKLYSDYSREIRAFNYFHNSVDDLIKEISIVNHLSDVSNEFLYDD